MAANNRQKHRGGNRSGGQGNNGGGGRGRGNGPGNHQNNYGGSGPGNQQNNYSNGQHPNGNPQQGQGPPWREHNHHRNPYNPQGGPKGRPKRGGDFQQNQNSQRPDWKPQRGPRNSFNRGKDYHDFLQKNSDAFNAGGLDKARLVIGLEKWFEETGVNQYLMNTGGHEEAVHRWQSLKEAADIEAPYQLLQDPGSIHRHGPVNGPSRVFFRCPWHTMISNDPLIDHFAKDADGDIVMCECQGNQAPPCLVSAFGRLRALNHALVAERDTCASYNEFMRVG